MFESDSQIIKLATVNWGIRPIGSEEQFFSHLRELVTESVKMGAQIVLLPELFELELLKARRSGEDGRVAEMLAPYAPLIERELVSLATEFSIVIIGGSHLKKESGGIYNYSPVAFPDGRLFFQPKNVRTQWEISPWELSERTGLISLPYPKLGVLVCYDSEFPEGARAHAEGGVELLCVPSYTESQHGFQRVNFSCRARAVENEIFVAQACIVGPIECFGLETGYGKSLIMTPSKAPFPSSAVLAETPLNQEGIACAEIDFGKLKESRSKGDARPWSDRKRSDWRRF